MKTDCFEKYAEGAVISFLPKNDQNPRFKDANRDFNICETCIYKNRTVLDKKECKLLTQIFIHCIIKKKHVKENGL